MKLVSSISCLAFIVLSIVVVSCEKTEVTIAPSQAHFVGDEIQIYSIEVDPAPVYNVVVGATNVADQDRTVTYTITSPTGAVAGTHYTLGSPGSVVIPAGQSTANIDVHGIYSAYTSGRKDTLIITLQDPELTPAEFENTVRLVLRGTCFEGDVDLNALLGDYNKTNETFGTTPYGPYTTSISSVNQLTPTSGTIVVENIFDFGWGPITFTLDWSDPNNRTAIVVAQSSGIADAGTLSGAYAGEEVAVRPFAGQPGTFSACKGTLTLKMQLGVAGLGYFGELYTVNMAR
jgi:hypothetical protein